MDLQFDCPKCGHFASACVDDDVNRRRCLKCKAQWNRRKVTEADAGPRARSDDPEPSHEQEETQKTTFTRQTKALLRTLYLAKTPGLTGWDAVIRAGIGEHNAASSTLTRMARMGLIIRTAEKRTPEEPTRDGKDKKQRQTIWLHPSWRKNRTACRCEKIKNQADEACAVFVKQTGRNKAHCRDCGHGLDCGHAATSHEVGT